MLIPAMSCLIMYVSSCRYGRYLTIRQRKESPAYANFHRTVVEQGLPFGNLEAFVNKEETGTQNLGSRWASFPRRIVVVLMSLAIAEAILVNSLLGESFA